MYIMTLIVIPEYRDVFQFGFRFGGYKYEGKVVLISHKIYSKCNTPQSG
jgi:hypothetical protein